MKHQLSWAKARCLSPRLAKYMAAWRSPMPLIVAIDLQLSKYVKRESGRNSDEDNHILQVFRDTAEAAIQDGALRHTTASAADYLNTPGPGARLNFEQWTDANGSKQHAYFPLPAPSEYEKFTLVTAEDFIQWLATTGEKPSEHIEAWLKAVVNQGGPPAVVNAIDKTHHQWGDEARQLATEIIKRQRKLDLFPSQNDIADEISSVFRTKGNPLSAGTIKRHALKGISSAPIKQVSTSIHRGK